MIVCAVVDPQTSEDAGFGLGWTLLRVSPLSGHNFIYMKYYTHNYVCTSPTDVRAK